MRCGVLSSLVCCAIVFGLLGCSSPSEVAAPDVKVFESALEGLERVRDEVIGAEGAASEWRDAVVFEGGREHRLALGGMGEAGLLRLGVRSARGDADIAYEVTALGQVLGSGSVGARNPWTDLHLPLPGLVSPTDGYTVTLRSDGTFWVSTVERFPATAPSTPVVVFLIDTLRQDHLGCYGYERPTSPNLDAFAKDAIVCTQLVPSSSWTRPSVASLLTSTYPERHGAQDRGARIREETPWITEPLEAAGYETHGINTNVNLLPMWGFSDPFQRYVDLDSANWVVNHDAEAVEKALGTLQQIGKRPLFMYVHTLSPHEPFDPPEPYRSRFVKNRYPGTVEQQLQAETVDLYDGEIARIDELFGKLMGFMRRSGMYDSSLIIVLSDHGEELYERGVRGHGISLYEEQLRVPLLIKLPKNRLAGTRHEGLIEMVDIAPTILEVLGLPAYAPFEGRSVLAELSGGASPDRVGYASLHLDAASMRAAKTTQRKYILDLVADEQMWFDLAVDPAEVTPLSEAPEGDPGLEQYAAYRSSVGTSGLHVLVTHDSSEALEVSVSLTHARVGEHELLYPDSLSTVSTTQETLTADLTFPEFENADRASAQWEQGLESDSILKNILKLHKDSLKSEQNHALLIVPAALDDTARLRVEVSGVPVELESVFVGGDHAQRALDGEAILLSDVIASSNRFDAASLPRRFGVYVWYVPSAENIDDAALPDDVREALEGLGYLN